MYFTTFIMGIELALKLKMAWPLSFTNDLRINQLSLLCKWWPKLTQAKSVAGCP